VANQSDVSRVGIGSHLLVKKGITVVPEGNDAQLTYGSVDGTLASDNDDGVASHTAQVIHPALRGFHFGIETANPRTETFGLKITQHMGDITEIRDGENRRRRQRDRGLRELRQSERPG
jgi:hypothetical protein